MALAITFFHKLYLFSFLWQSLMFLCYDTVIAPVVSSPLLFGPFDPNRCHFMSAFHMSANHWYTPHNLFWTKSPNFTPNSTYADFFQDHLTSGCNALGSNFLQHRGYESLHLMALELLFSCWEKKKKNFGARTNSNKRVRRKPGPKVRCNLFSLTTLQTLLMVDDANIPCLQSSSNSSRFIMLLAHNNSLGESQIFKNVKILCIRHLKNCEMSCLE